MSPRPLNVGLIGGSGAAFIVHPQARAVHLDGTRRVVAAALSSNPKKAVEAAAKWAYPVCGYESYDAMLAAQKKLPVGGRLDYVVIVTPNHAHFDPAAKAMKAGIAVFCEKPLTLNLAEATALVKLQRKTGVPFGVAHTYLGHWTSRFARYIVRRGLIGDVRWVDSAYIQGWLATKLEATGQTQAKWRVNPKLAGASGCGGDIGTHALMQLRYVTGLEVTRLSAQLETFVSGRQLDDHFTVYCHLNNGARALVRASQICIGHKNDLGIEVAGSRGTLRWRQEEPECVTIHLPSQPDRVYWRSMVAPGDGFLPRHLPADLLAEPTLPSGHAEGFHDAFARLHRNFEEDVRHWQTGKKTRPDGSRYANIEDGWTGMAFIETAVKSSARKGAWLKMPKPI